MNLQGDISQLLKEGHSHEEIFEVLVEEFPELKDESDQLIKEGLNKQDILETFVELGEDDFKNIFTAPEQASSIASKPRKGNFREAAEQLPLGVTAGVVETPRATTELVKEAPSMFQQGQKNFLDFLGFGDFGDELSKSAEFFQQTEDDLAEGAVGLFPETAQQGVRNIFDELRSPIQQAQKRDTLGGIEQLFLSGPLPGSVQQAAEEVFDTDLTPQTPLGRISRRTGEFTGSGVFGGPEASLVLGASGLAGQTARELGAPEGVAEAIEIIPSIFQMRPKVSQQDIINQQRKIQTGKINDLRKNILSIEKEPLPGKNGLKFKAQQSKISIPEKPVVGEFNPKALNKQVQREATENLLNGVAFNIGTPEEALSQVKNRIQENFVRDRAKASNFYDLTSSQLEGTTLDMTETFESIAALQEQIEQQGLPPQGAQSAKGFLDSQKKLFIGEEAAQDIAKLKQRKAATRSRKEKKVIDKLIENIELSAAQNVTPERALQIKKNFNAFLDFEFPDLQTKAKAKSIFNKTRKTAKQNINDEIRRKNKDAFVNWRKAELTHQKNAELYGKDAVIDIQRSESPLRSRKDIKDPVNFGSLKDAVGKNPEANVLDRLALEEMNLSKTTAEKERVFSDFKKRMSSNAASVGEEIIDIQDPSTPKGLTRAKQGIITDEIGKLAVAGDFPDTTVRMMNEPKGLKLVRDTLNLTEEGRTVLPLVEDLWVRKHLNSVQKNGVINSGELKKFLGNPDLVSTYRKIAGQEAVDFLKGIQAKNEKISNLFKSPKQFSKTPTKKLVADHKKFMDGLVNQAKNLGLSLSFLKFIGVDVGTGVQALAGLDLIRRTSSKLFQNPKIRSIVRSIQKTSNKQIATRMLLNLNKEIEKELESLSAEKDVKKGEKK